MTTVTDQTRETYYGLPMVRAPHWGWLVIFYFFLEGMAGATHAVATLADLFGHDRRLVRSARYLSFLLGLSSPVLLTLDLKRPERALNMFRIVKLRSPMSIGAWVLLITSLLSGLSAVMQLVSDLLGRELFGRTHRVLGVMAIPFTTLISGYTGTLLEATSIPLWARSSPLLGPLFFSSSFSSALASVGLTSRALDRTKGRPARAMDLSQPQILTMTAQLGILAAMIVRLGRLGRPLTAGTWGRIFWPVTVCSGLAAPLLILVSVAVRGRDPRASTRTVAAILTLVGGFSLRALMIFAGRESASRPGDYLEYTS